MGMEARVPVLALTSSLGLMVLALACAPTPATAPATPGGAVAPAPGAPGAPAPAAQMEPVRGGVFRIGNHGDLVDFDMATEGGALHLSVGGLVQSGMLKWDKSPIFDQTKVTCDLCETWRQVNETSYEFKLRQGVKWQNVPPVNGRELVAADYKYTVERIQNLGFKNITQFGRHLDKVRNIKSVETPDKYTVKVEMKEPRAIALMDFGDPFILVVAKEQVDEALSTGDGLLRKGLVGTGPFILKEFTPKVSYTMVRNPDYFGKDAQGRPLPYLDGAEVRFIPDNTTRFNAFRAGEIHDPGFFMSEESKRIIDRQHPDLFMGRVPGQTTAGFAINLKRKPFDDVRVRKAMYLAFDRQGLIDATRFGQAQLARWVATPAKGAYATPEEELKKTPGFRQPKDQDVAEAKKLLAEAGLASGFKTTMSVIKSGDIEANAEVFAEQMRKSLGIDIALQPMERAVHEKEVAAGTFDLSAEYTIFGSTPDPAETMWLIEGGNPNNYIGYSNPTMSELFEKQSRTLNVEERKKLFFQMYDILDREVPIIPAYTDNNYKGYPKKCHNINEEPRYNTLIRYMFEAWCEAGVLK